MAVNITFKIMDPNYLGQTCSLKMQAAINPFKYNLIKDLKGYMLIQSYVFKPQQLGTLYRDMEFSFINPILDLK